MNIKKQLAKLIDVKSTVTFAVVGVFAYLAVAGQISSENVMIIVTTIITFFFAKNKKSNKESED